MLLYLFPELEEALGLKLHNTLNAENDSIKRKVSMTLLLILIVCLPLKQKHPRELKNPEQVLDQSFHVLDWITCFKKANIR